MPISINCPKVPSPSANSPTKSPTSSPNQAPVAMPPSAARPQERLPSTDSTRRRSTPTIATFWTGKPASDNLSTAVRASS